MSKAILSYAGRWNWDRCIYALIAGLGAAQAYISAGELPKSWGPGVGIALVSLTALKAKRSSGAS